MKRVIDGKLYDTTTATLIADISPPGFYPRDFQWEDTQLYRSPKGQFFAAGQGGPMSRWAVSVGQNSRTDGNGMELINFAEAKCLVEQHCSAPRYAELFEVEEG